MPKKKNIKVKHDTMEVHHHPQLHHQPKPWKEYFLEFLMIFLAVTLGFFAENIREYFVEKHRAHDYAQSLYDDLKADTAFIQRTWNEKAWIQAKYDSAGKILVSGDIAGNNEFLYYLESYIGSNDVFTSQDVTYQQLRSSGNFRYIRNVTLYKKIAGYYNLYSRYQSVDGNFGNVGKNELSELESRIFSAADLASLDNENAGTFYDLFTRPPAGKKLAMMSTDKKDLNLLYMKIAIAKNRTKDAKNFLGWLKADAVALMNELRTEYDLE